ncbi:hypothetical protein ASZ78_007640 [Callipepla squamata]|uniref:Coiled-coil domain-containing protein 84 n=1 Tax=Callipepla squamata TaxID=9009 RepID=A0A226MUT5_CALSU|nr:hypothetical protein ASZ78_007640 [Callipepla squamata]
MAVYYCALCRRTSFTGRRHLYSAAHRRRLRDALDRLEEEVAAARAAVDGADVRRYDPEEHERRAWCPCCGRGVRTDARSGAVAVPHAGFLQHLAGAEHRREAARFCRENRVEAALRERFVVAAEEYARFAAAMERAVGAYEEREEESIRQMAAQIREAERRQRDTVRAALERCFRLISQSALHLLHFRDTSSCAELPGPSVVQTGPDLSWMGSGQALTFIGHQETEGKGNVHTGAKPPWLTEEDEEDGSRQQIGPSYEEFLKQSISLELNQGQRRKKGDQKRNTEQTKL